MTKMKPFSFTHHDELETSLSLLSSSSVTLSNCTSSYPGGGSKGGAKTSAGGECGLLLLTATPESLCLTELSSGPTGVADARLFSYVGSSSKCTLPMFTPARAPPPPPALVSLPSPVRWPLSRATSTACCSRSLIRSNVLWKSKAPPSLNVILSSIAGYWAGMPPLGTGCSIAVHTLGPKKGAATRVSCILSMGAVKDCMEDVGVAGRYTN